MKLAFRAFGLIFSTSLLLLSTSVARAVLLAYEPFTNATGTAITGSSGGSNFINAWQANSSGGIATNMATGLAYTDASSNTLVTLGGAAFFQGLTTANTSMQPTRAFNFSRGTNGTDGVTTWISFLIVRQGPVNGSVTNGWLRGANVPHDLGTLQKLAVGNSSGAATNTVGLIPQGAATNLKPSTTLFGGRTNFVVVRIDHIAGTNNDNAWLFVNPNLAAEPPTNAANTNSLGAFDFSFDTLRMFAGGQSSASQPYAEMIVDEYRIGETYADVTPFTPFVPIAPAGPLIITNTARVGSSIVLAGIGGTSNATYNVLSSSSLLVNSTNWPAIATNTFDSSGNFTCTNPLASAPGATFFRLFVPAITTPTPPMFIGATYYVATNGNDSSNGTLAAPFKTIGKGLTAVSNGGIVYVRGGTYALASKLSLSKTANPTNTIRLWAYPGEVPVIDSTGNSSDGIGISGDWYHLRGLTVTLAGHNGVNISGDSNIVENCVTHDNGNTGLHLTGPAAPGPTGNLILNCDSYRNYDIGLNGTNGGNADGFSAKWDIGPGNVFDGCRAWENSDDGWDFWMGTSPVLLTNCWAFRNGIDFWSTPHFDGNGNGFKLGGNYVGAPHMTVRCIAFGNVAHGIDQNNNISGQVVDQNTSWNNGARNFNLNHGTNTTPHIVRNNLSIAGGSSDSFRSGTLATNNSWQVISPAPTSADVQSVDTSVATAPRNADGSLPVWPFLRPVEGGRLVDKGADVGQAYNGAAPDLGAYEVGQ